jgi:hypothetical protein
MKRGKYVKRRPRRPANGPHLVSTNRPSTAVTIFYTPGITYTTVIDPDEAGRRDEACRKVDELAGQRGKDGKRLTRNERIKLAAKEYGFDFATLRNYKNRAKPK